LKLVKADPVEIASQSLSARRAWIETSGCAGRVRFLVVALRKEGVD